jgi:phosphatidylglycerol lysyltransferase
MRRYQFRPPASESRSNSRSPLSRELAWQSILPRAVTALVAGSGILNLVSLMTPAPATQAWLHGVFPLDFAGLFRTLTLVAGFALVLSAIHLWTRQRRAWQFALGLAAASTIFHLTKGWNTEEAAGSALLAGVLWLTRRAFPVGAGRPQLVTATFRAAAAFAIAGLYGACGFWLLEPSAFHYDFRWWDAVVRTVRLMLFIGDPSLIPHTPHAAWFLDSLYWMSAAAFLYSGVVLFRPVVYRFRLDLDEFDHAGRIAIEHGQTALDYFKHWPDKSYFFSASGQSFLGYRVAGNFALVLGDPVGPEEDLAPTIREFVAHCQKRGWRVGFHQAGAGCLPVYESLGFRKLKLGDDAIVDLTQFSLSGSAAKEFRNTVSRLDRLGYRVERIEPRVTEPLLSELERLSDRWLEIPGHRERRFTLGRFERWYLRSTPVYVVFDEQSRAVAFLNLVPSYEPGLVTVDLMRRLPDSINGVMDYLFAKVFLDLKQRGEKRFSLGMAPAPGMGSNNLDARLANWLMNHAPFLFRADSLRRFKAKYADEWQPRYAVYQGRLDLPRLALALRRVSEDRKAA